MKCFEYLGLVVVAGLNFFEFAFGQIPLPLPLPLPGAVPVLPPLKGYHATAHSEDQSELSNNLFLKDSVIIDPAADDDFSGLFRTAEELSREQIGLMETTVPEELITTTSADEPSSFETDFKGPSSSEM